MDFKVLIADSAIADLKEIVEFVAEDNPEAAIQLGEKLLGHRQLFPYNSRRMSRAEKLFDKLTAGRNDANFSFDDLCTLLTKLGYNARKTKGSHIIFHRGSSFLNLQPSTGGKAKSYQVRQVRHELQKLNLKP